MSTSAFQALHEGDRPFLLPNAWDVASGLLLADAGFPAIGTTSFGITAAAGLSDGEGAGRELTVALAAELVARLAIPVSVDLEGGYADDPGAVAALVAELAAIGVGGVNLEDGRPAGDLRPAHQHAAIISAVTAAAPSLFVNARTDTYWLMTGPDDERLDQTTERLCAYEAAGASGVFVPGLTDLEGIAEITSAVPLPFNALWQPGASFAALGAVGVTRVSTGSALYRHALGAALSVTSAARDEELPPATPIEYGALQRLIDHTSRGRRSA